jgi:hypothetical protein
MTCIQRNAYRICGNTVGNVYLEDCEGAKDNIKLDPRETNCEDRRWMKTGQNLESGQHTPSPHVFIG